MPSQPPQLRVVKDRSGDNPKEDDGWRAEPGSNGLFLLSSSSTTATTTNTLLVCQHGARRVAALDVTSEENKEEEEETETEKAPTPTNKMTIPLASEWNNRKFNGANDIAIHHEEEEDGKKIYAYFTDPVYAWLEKDRFEDLPYLDERVKKENGGGPGHCGVYKFQLEWNGMSWGRLGDVELVQVMERPNGIGFLENDDDDDDDDDDDKKKDKMIVSDCCQGSHLENCKQGTSRWTVFQQNNKGEWIKDFVIESTLQGKTNELYGGGKGCADGFAIHDYIDRVTQEKKRVLIASCSDGLCIVDVKQKKVVTRLWTVKKSGCKVSNVAIGKNGWVYLTGNCGILGLPLRGEHQTGHAEL